MIHSTGERKPNDPKLSHGRAWRGGCVAGERWRQEAADVTCTPVGCSAWLGDVGFMWDAESDTKCTHKNPQSEKRSI